VKLVTSLPLTNILLTVLIISFGLAEGRILYTMGKGWVEHVANMREICVQVLVGKVDKKKFTSKT
jgi:hypothetical protein